MNNIKKQYEWHNNKKAGYEMLHFSSCNSMVKGERLYVIIKQQNHRERVQFMIIEENTGKNVSYYFRKVERAEIKNNKYTPNGGWDFDWVKPLTQSFEIYALITEDYSNEVQGLIALKPNLDPDYMCVDIEIVESSPNNKKMNQENPNYARRYIGIGKCLLAFACQYSIENGLDGFVSLTSKSSKIPFYLKLGGHLIYNRNVMFDPQVSKRLSAIYFKGGIQWWEK